jgi:hypothetical protein
MPAKTNSGILKFYKSQVGGELGESFKVLPAAAAGRAGLSLKGAEVPSLQSNLLSLSGVMLCEAFEAFCYATSMAWHTLDLNDLQNALQQLPDVSLPARAARYSVYLLYWYSVYLLYWWSKYESTNTKVQILNTDS